MRIEIKPWRRTQPGRRGGASSSAFTLLEVLIAVSIFCLMAFAVLEIVVTGMGAARALQVRHADPSVLAAELVATNTILEEGAISGDFGDFYPHARWEREITEVGSNGLFRVDFLVSEKIGKRDISSTMSILLHSPGSPKGRMSGGTGRATGPQPVP
jgi:prepilin-type N-terminal cleavage/methylation domain-containing protein